MWRKIIGLFIYFYPLFKGNFHIVKLILLNIKDYTENHLEMITLTEQLDI